METFGQRIRPAVDVELQSAAAAEAAGQSQASFQHLDRGHVLRQASTVQHVRVHVRLLSWALRHRARREARGQALRIVGAVTKTALGLGAYREHWG